MNVSLTPELKDFVQAKIESGQYNSESEVVCEALRLLEDREKSRAPELNELRSEIDRRLASLDRGEGVDGEVAFARIREKSAERRNRPA